MRGVLVISFLLHFMLAYSQQEIIDSLTTRLGENLHDTDRANTLNELGWKLMYNNPDTSVILSSEALLHAEKHNWMEGMATSYRMLGVFNYLKGEYHQSLDYYKEGLNIYVNLLDNRSLNNKALAGMASILGNIGVLHLAEANYPKSIEFLLRALQLDEELENKNGVSRHLANIGLVYRNQRDYPKALEYHFKALEMSEELDQPTAVAMLLGNIGLVYLEQGNRTRALEFYFRAIKMDKELNRQYGVATNLGNIANAYKEQGDSIITATKDRFNLVASDKFTNALEYYSQALEINERINNKNGISRDLGNLGALYIKIVKYDKAETVLLKAIALSEDLRAKERLKFQYKYLSNLYDSLQRPSRALEAFKLHIIYRDSINNEENIKIQTRTEMKYEYEKAELVKQQVEKETVRLEAEKLSRRDNMQYSVVLIGLLLLGGALVALGRFEIPVKITEGLIFFSFLILFEFLLVLADPYIDNWSGGAPGIKLLFNAGIAALIFPLHSLFENKLKRRLVKQQ